MSETERVPDAPRYGAVDVHYSRIPSGAAAAALVVYAEPQLAIVVSDFVAMVPHSAPYVPGEFYRRELPCIQAAIALSPRLDFLVVDGYATLNPDGQPGLGAYCAELFGIPVIGVAKKPYRTATHALQVFRGSATKPLYVTASGLATGAAAQIVNAMAGAHRIPAALSRADRLAREAITDSASGTSRVDRDP